ncbi:MAG: hypothetical protein KGI50_07930 [Patescibacteria group bacterium]|nr:hypothetical protein [Patescibacteria group bacterium]
MNEALGRKSDQKKSVTELLDEAGLSLEETLENLRITRDMSESESTRTRINEAVLKMHGVMKEDSAAMPIININIIDPNKPAENPIFLPRELHKMKESETIQ